MDYNEWARRFMSSESTGLRQTRTSYELHRGFATKYHYYERVMNAHDPDVFVAKFPCGSASPIIEPSIYSVGNAKAQTESVWPAGVKLEWIHEWEDCFKNIRRGTLHVMFTDEVHGLFIAEHGDTSFKFIRDSVLIDASAINKDENYYLRILKWMKVPTDLEAIGERMEEELWQTMDRKGKWPKRGLITSCLASPEQLIERYGITYREGRDAVAKLEQQRRDDIDGPIFGSCRFWSEK